MRTGLRHYFSERQLGTFDELDRLKSAEAPTFAGGGIMTYTYDSANQRTGLESPSGRFIYTYDLAGRMTSLVNPDGERTTFTYDNAGQRTVTQLANGTRESITYNQVGSVQRVANIRSDSTTISSYLYSYNAGESRIAEIWEDGTRVTWTYDNAYRLTNELRPGANGFHVTHTYDPVGNRTKKTEDGVDTDYTYNAGNQLVTEVTGGSRTTYTFDVAGNQETVETASSRTTMTWDYENRRTKHEQASLVHEDQYDCDGRRFREQKSVFGATQYTRKHVWDMENVLYETDGSNAIQVAYTLEPAGYGNLISQRYAGNSRYYHFDALGSVRQLTDAVAAFLYGYEYNAYGGPAADSALATLDQPFTFVGRLGYYTGIAPGTYVRQRWYKPTIIVWLSEDPLGKRAYDFQARALAFGRPFWNDRINTNLYRYVENYPVTLHDPSGLVPPIFPFNIPVPWYPPPVNIYPPPPWPFPPRPPKPQPGSRTADCLKIVDACKDNCLKTFWFPQDCLNGCNGAYVHCINPDDVISVPSNSPVCDKYPCDYYYSGANAKCFCKCAGDSPWSNFVRGCLSQLYDKQIDPIDPSSAHEICYNLATIKFPDQAPKSTLLECWAICAVR